MLSQQQHGLGVPASSRRSASADFWRAHYPGRAVGGLAGAGSIYLVAFIGSLAKSARVGSDPIIRGAILAARSFVVALRVHLIDRQSFCAEVDWLGCRSMASDRRNLSLPPGPKSLNLAAKRHIKVAYSTCL